MILFTSMEYAQSADGLYCMLGILGAYKQKKFILVHFIFILCDCIFLSFEGIGYNPLEASKAF